YLGRTHKGTLALALLDAGYENSLQVIDRLIGRIENYGFPTALRVEVGAACYPTHAVDAGSLARQALARPIVAWRGGNRVSAPNGAERRTCHDPHPRLTLFRSRRGARADREPRAPRAGLRIRRRQGREVRQGRQEDVGDPRRRVPPRAGRQ